MGRIPYTQNEPISVLKVLFENVFLKVLFWHVGQKFVIILPCVLQGFGESKPSHLPHAATRTLMLSSFGGPSTFEYLMPVFEKQNTKNPECNKISIQFWHFCGHGVTFIYPISYCI